MFLVSPRSAISTYWFSSHPLAGIMLSRRARSFAFVSVFLAVWAWNVSAAAVKGETGAAIGDLTVGEIEDKLQVCAPIRWTL